MTTNSKNRFRGFYPGHQEQVYETKKFYSKKCRLICGSLTFFSSINDLRLFSTGANVYWSIEGAGLRQRARNPLPMEYAQWIKQSRNDKMENKFGIAWTLGFFGSQFLVVGLRTCGKQYCYLSGCLVCLMQ